MKDIQNKKVTPITFTKQEINNFIELARILKKIEIRRQLDKRSQSLSDTKHIND